LIIDARGRQIASGRSGLTFQRIGRDGFEQDANSWWEALCQSCQEALRDIPEDRHKDIVAMCIAHQRETIVMTDARGEPLAPALLWMDSRCHEEVSEAERTVGTVRLHAVSGKPACTTPSLYKLMFLLRNRPELRDVACVHDVHSFLSLKLTGRAVSSFASADPTGLVDMRKKAWSRSLTSLVGVEPHQLPELSEVGYFIGSLTPRARAQTGLPDHVLLYAGSGDGQLAGLGAGVTGQGSAFIDIGTAVSCGTITNRYEIDRAFRTLHAAIPGRYCLETTLRGGMLTLWWLVEAILQSPERTAKMLELEKEARNIPPTSDGLVMLPYLSGVMSPYWDDAARGAFVGLHSNHGPGHLYRSILEGIALEQRLHLEGVKHAVGRLSDQIVVLGGGSRSDLWCQIFADVLGTPVRRCRTPEAPALGAAVLAAVSHGVYPSFERAAEEMTQLATIFEPGPNSEVYERLYRDVYRGMYLELASRMAALAKLRQMTSPEGGPSIPPPASRQV
jgi:xylulokinase